MKNKDRNIFTYEINADVIRFLCTDFIHSESVMSLFLSFLIDSSKGKNVFFDAYRLSYEDIAMVVDPLEIIEQAKSTYRANHVCMHLKRANMRSQFFNLVEATIYYFNPSVKWTDFLMGSHMNEKERIKANRLASYLTIADHGSVCWFEGNLTCKKDVLDFLARIQDCGYKIERSHHLSFS